MSQELVSIDLEYMSQTDDAVLVKSDWGNQVWIPKSLCSGVPYAIDNLDENSNIKLKVRHWFALKEGLI